MEAVFVNIFMATKYIPDDGPCETETCHVVVGGHEIGAVEPGTARRAALKIYVYQVQGISPIEIGHIFHIYKFIMNQFDIPVCVLDLSVQ
jgi:hypothetical protein